MKFQSWAFLKELIPLAILLVILDYLLFDKKLFAFQPSPLWLLILLIAPRRGSIAGIVCGLTAAGLNLWSIHAQGFLWEDLLHRQGTVLLSSGLFIFFGAFLGAVGERQIGRMEFFRQKAKGLATQLDAEQIKGTELERFCMDMEKRIAGQGTTILTLYDNFKRLDEASNEDELLFALEYILRDESKAEKYGVWRIEKDTGILVSGNFNGDIPPIARAVGKNHRVLSAADWSRRHKRPPGADLAALVLDNESERLVVAVSGCPFVRLTRVFCLRVGLLTEQAGLVLGALRDREKLLSQATLDTDSGLVSETYLRRRINEEVAVVRQYNTRLVLLACSISSQRQKALPLLETVLARSIRASVRYSDGVAWFAEAKAFVVVLPQCGRDGAATVIRKIVDNIKTLDLRDTHDHDQEIYKLAWNVYVSDGMLKGEDLFERLFSGIGNEAAA